jgi:hypothetical protein
MTDIVERIRSLRYVHVPVASGLMEEAAAEIKRLRNGAAEGCETVRLTDVERECLEWAEEIAGNCEEFDRVDTLRSLLERLA